MTPLDSMAIEFDIDDHTFKQIPIENIEINSSDSSKIYWVHSNLNQGDLHLELIKRLQLPEDVDLLCHQDDPTPQLIDKENAITIQIQSLIFSKKNHGNEIKMGNLIIHLTSQ